MGTHAHIHSSRPTLRSQSGERPALLPLKYQCLLLEMSLGYPYNQGQRDATQVRHTYTHKHKNRSGAEPHFEPNNTMCTWRKLGKVWLKVFFFLSFSFVGGIDRFNMRVCVKTPETRSESSAWWRIQSNGALITHLLANARSAPARGYG